jgi:hypothetical protein
LLKYPTDTIIMTPTPNVEIQLDQLNVMIAEQKNCAVDDLCNFVSGAQNKQKKLTETPTAAPVVNTVEEAASVANDLDLPEQDRARNYRSQADALYKEAARLRREADSLDPPKKKTAKAEEQVS